LDTSVVLLFRAAERLLIVGAASLCIFLGYRLFQSLPTFHGSEGKLIFLKTSVSLSKIGPGVFFALFGAFVLWRSTENVLVLNPPVNPTTQTSRQAAAAIYFGPEAAPNTPGNDTRAQHARADIAIINCIGRGASPYLATLGQPTVETALHNARVGLLETAWQLEWGGKKELEELRNGNIPTSGQLAEIYNAQNARCNRDGIDSK
jgi:hypothetical protein